MTTPNLTDAELAAALRLTIAQFQAARRRRQIPEPAVTIAGARWTRAQLAAILGETPGPADHAAAEARIMEAIGGR
jgi:hypothetical protein